jgi:PadR family transcriptional regulator, regulatory protein PadR
VSELQPKIRVTKRLKRVLLVLLTGAPDLSGYVICRAAGMGSGSIYPELARLERAGWVDSYREVPDPAGRSPRRFYRLTPEGRAAAFPLLGLTEPFSTLRG